MEHRHCGLKTRFSVPVSFSGKVSHFFSKVFWPKCSLIRRELFLGKSCTFKTDEDALTLSSQGCLTLSRESGNLLCILLHNLSLLDHMRFKLDFEALHIYFVQKEITYLKKCIPGSQTALVSCKTIVYLTGYTPSNSAVFVCCDKILVEKGGYDFQIWKLITMSHVSLNLFEKSAFRNTVRRLALLT